MIFYPESLPTRIIIYINKRYAGIHSINFLSRKAFHTIVLLYCIYSTAVCATVITKPKNSAPWVGTDLSGAPCHGNGQGYGPFDYTNPIDREKKLPIVTKFHFTPEVERLIRGESGSVGGDLDYTLRAFPNHHRALYSIIKYKMKMAKIGKALSTPPECYLQRAINYKNNNDPVTEMLYGLYLQNMKHYKDALTHYRMSIKLNPKASETHYNLGLLYYDMKKYKEARTQSDISKKLGYPLHGLSKMLNHIGE